MPMPTDFYLFCLVILIAAGTLTVTVCLLDRWLVKADKLPAPLWVRKIRKKYEPPVPPRHTVYPDGRKEI